MCEVLSPLHNDMRSIKGTGYNRRPLDVKVFGSSSYRFQVKLTAEQRSVAVGLFRVETDRIHVD